MKKKLMTLEQRRLLREAQQLLALSERQKACSCRSWGRCWRNLSLPERIS